MQFNGKLLSITSQVNVYLEAKREDLGFEGLPATYIFWSPSYRCYYLTFSFLLPINKLVLIQRVKISNELLNKKRINSIVNQMG